jgi:hypothetical protein
LESINKELQSPIDRALKLQCVSVLGLEHEQLEDEAWEGNGEHRADRTSDAHLEDTSAALSSFVVLESRSTAGQLTVFHSARKDQVHLRCRTTRGHDARDSQALMMNVRAMEETVLLQALDDPVFVFVADFA